MRAESTALTGDRVDLEVSDGLKAAQFLAQAAFCALPLIDNGNLPAPELVILPNFRFKYQV